MHSTTVLCIYQYIQYKGIDFIPLVLLHKGRTPAPKCPLAMASRESNNQNVFVLRINSIKEAPRNAVQHFQSLERNHCVWPQMRRITSY